MKAIQLMCLICGIVSLNLYADDYFEEVDIEEIVEDVGELFEEMDGKVDPLSIRTRRGEVKKVFDLIAQSKMAPVRIVNPIGDYEAHLPNEASRKNLPHELDLTRAYLDNPEEVLLAKYLAIYNLLEAYSQEGEPESVERLILSLYYLNRYSDLGGMGHLVDLGIKYAEDTLSSILDYEKVVVNEETRSFSYFLYAFTQDESKRYKANRKLFRGLVKEPGNVVTNFAIAVAHTWNAGESDYNDPIMLNDTIIASYFAIRSTYMTEQAERLWEKSPEHYERFRLGNMIGGFSVSARRWLAKLHGDNKAIEVMDDEHRAWYRHHKAFHAFTLGASFYGEPENFLEGFDVWQYTLLNCEFTVRTCVNRPRFSFNRAGFSLGFVDFLLKVGAKDFARNILGFKFDPDSGFSDWVLGRDSWEHRENNMDAIVAANMNDNPDDDPALFVTSKKKWADSMSTCQSCHQQQNRYWSEEERSTIWLHEDAILTIGDYPEVTTSWYGKFDRSHE